jgi:hypothetical protein
VAVLEAQAAGVGWCGELALGRVLGVLELTGNATGVFYGEESP